MLEFDALIALAAALPPIARPLRDALAAYQATPSRDAWRVVCTLVQSTACNHDLSDAQCEALTDAAEDACEELGHPDLADLVSPSMAEVRQQIAEIPALDRWMRSGPRGR